MSIFREIAGRIKHRHDAFSDEVYVDHASLKDTSNAQFDFIFQPLLSQKENRDQYAALARLTSLPDREHWLRYQTSENEEAVDFSTLAAGFAKCFDHQSQEATDIRWLIVMTHLANDKLRFDPSMEERFLTIIDYPNRGDMRSVRPSIRAMEISMRGDPHEKDMDKKKKRHETASEAIWSELYHGTNCIPLPVLAPVAFDYRPVVKEAFGLYKDLVAHFFDNIATTALDARLESSFGLTFYVIALVIEGASLRAYHRVSAKLLLRTIFEAHINLRFLLKKDDETIWFQYRNYGTSQAKLAFLKYLDAKQKPDYVNIQELFHFANEDMWLEFQDINLGSWASKSLREIALEAGLKDAYDQHYSILSTASHAQWTALREENFTQCANPLHRYHRIPDMPRFLQEDFVAEMCKFANQMLDDLNELYPPFKKRLRAYKSVKGTKFSPPEDKPEGNSHSA